MVHNSLNRHANTEVGRFNGQAVHW